MGEELLRIDSLRTTFATDSGKVAAVDDVSFSIKPGGAVGLVGESGCGKSVTALSVMGLLPRPQAATVGSIWYRDSDLLKLPDHKMRKVRGKEIAMVFQEPMTSLNPVFTIGDQITEALYIHENMSSKDATERAIEMLKLVNIPSPERRIADYPHQLSGGMRQRVMIAMAACCNPSLLIADEPTTALDVTIQAGILDLLQDLRERLGTAILLITHDMGVVAQNVDEVVVMYAGKIVERGLTEDLFGNTLHPYTIGLLNSIPSLVGEKRRLQAIPGSVPDPLDFPEGCRFHPRCVHAVDRCRAEIPELRAFGGGHYAACHLANAENGGAAVG